MIPLIPMQFRNTVIIPKIPTYIYRQINKKMLSEYKKAVLNAYQKKKNEGQISINLVGLSPKQLRNECINVYKERPSDEDEEILRSFFGSRHITPSYTEIIESIDIDKFRPVKNFIVGKTTKPELRVVELLAWLIDFKPRPYPVWLINERAKSKNEPINRDHPTSQVQPTNNNEGNKPNELVDKPPFIVPKAMAALSLFAILSLGAYLYWEMESTESYSPTKTKEKCMH